MEPPRPLQYPEVLPESYGSSSFVHKYFQAWQAAGVFRDLWQRGVEVYDQKQGIKCRWQSIDGAMTKAPLAQEQVGPNPTDRGKKWKQASRPRGREWSPLVGRRQRREPA